MFLSKNVKNVVSPALKLLLLFIISDIKWRLFWFCTVRLTKETKWRRHLCLWKTDTSIFQFFWHFADSMINQQWQTLAATVQSYKPQNYSKSSRLWSWFKLIIFEFWTDDLTTTTKVIWRCCCWKRDGNISTIYWHFIN